MWIICYDKLYKCICYVLHEFSCWASAHGCSVLQVRAMTESTNHEYGEREATCTCLACPTALVGVYSKMAVIIYNFIISQTVTLFQDVISFQTLFWDPNCLIIEVLMKRCIFKDYSLNF